MKRHLLALLVCLALCACAAQRQACQGALQPINAPVAQRQPAARNLQGADRPGDVP